MLRSIAHLGPFATVAVCILMASCRAPWSGPAHIVHYEDINPMIIGGAALTAGEIRLDGATRIVVPSESISIMEGEPSDGILVFVRKSLRETEHPPELQDIADFQEGMGCCYRRTGDKLEITSFGEFHRAGTSVRLALVIPPGIEVETDSSLGATSSDFNGISPISLEGDWVELEDAPDPDGAKAYRDDVWPREWFAA